MRAAPPGGALCARLVDAWSELSSPTRRTQLRSLPLALTSIHATSWLRALLEDGLLERSLLAHGPPRGFAELLPRYRELFVELFEGFVAEWARRAPESVMHFEEVAAAFVPRVRQALRCGRTLKETLAAATDEATSDGAAPRAAAPPPPALRWPCFFINLKSRPDRRRRMERMLRGHGVAAVRVDAVPKEAPPVRAILEEFPAKRAGNVACSLSHFEAWRRVLALPAGQRAALVLEDDVRFLRGWRQQLEAHVHQMEQAEPAELGMESWESWDIFYLDCAHGSGWDFGLRGLQSACNVMYTDAYMITKEAARAALAMVEEDDSLDVEGVLLALQDRGRCFTTLPKLALQRWDDSDIQSGGRVRGIAKWYATSYHATFQEALYHDWDDCVI